MLSLGSKDNDDENDNDTSCITSPFPVVLVMGATCVDRILFCPHHPQPDEKLRTTHTTEVSGGNAANTAAALALVSSAAAFRFRFRFRHNNKNSLRVVLVTKVGDDESGANLEKDLESKGVDCSTPFFEKVPNTTTSITTVIASESQHTRTCLYTPGSCGEWTKEQILQRLQSYDLFRNVVWFHSDSRHTEAALVLANEATKRGIPISVDVEKDRGGGMPRLVAQASVLFGNQEKLQQYAIRRLLLPQQHLDVNPISAFLEDQSSDEKVLPKNIKSVVVTRGDQGAYQIEKKLQEKGDGPPLSNADDDCNNHNSRYTILRVGTLKDATIVDTTGAGDAFIAGYIMSLVAPKNLPFKNQPTEALFRLRFASWVAGRKLAGPGQQALPNGKDVDQHLGLSRDDVERRLERIVAPPPASVDKSKAIR